MRITAGEGLEALADLQAERTGFSHWPSLIGFSILGLGFSLVLGGGLITTTAATLFAAIVYGAFALLERPLDDSPSTASTASRPRVHQLPADTLQHVQL